MEDNPQQHDSHQDKREGEARTGRVCWEQLAQIQRWLGLPLLAQ